MTSSPNVCFNSQCSNPTPERPRKGWRLHSGHLSLLCDGCSSTYEEGIFCETFHSKASGWRQCESCGKQIHCGCIVSSHLFVLLDPGGVECLKCARENVVVTSDPAWMSSLLPLSERLEDASVRKWSQSAGSGPMPWRQGSACEQSPGPSLEKKIIENVPQRYMNGCLNFGASEVYEKSKTGNSHEEQHSSCLNVSQQSSSSLKDDPYKPQFGLTVPCTSTNETSGRIGVYGTHSKPSPPSSLTKQVHGHLRSAIDILGKTQTRIGKSQRYFRGRNQLLSRYCPKITDQELQQISGDSKPVITPLFEKTLSASDAGRIGRLVLPKLCAEVYFPQISQPEGFPLKIQDMNGKDWTFQYRFWPNNNSRMYVLEGVTHCIQSKQLQAGDIVIFSRLEPEGKLMMSFRKGSATPSDQNNETANTGNGVAAHGDIELTDPGSWEKVNEVGYVAKEDLEAKFVHRKRKNSALVLKSNFVNGNEDLIEVKLNREEAQGLLRPPPEHIPSVVVIEGFEFEEYENAPILGKPINRTADKTREMVQWVQCEDCFKWRKLPADALLPPRWTCSDNSWDTERSLCSAAQELTLKQLENLLTSVNSATSKELKAGKQDLDNVENSEVLDGLANLAMLGDGEAISSSQATTKHPCHRPGCSCIVCIQRRFQTLALQRAKNHSEEEAEGTQKHQQQSPLAEHSSPNQQKVVKSSISPFKGQIDLNIQPEREEEQSSGSDPMLHKDSTKIYSEQHTPSTEVYGHDGSGEKVSNGVVPVCSTADATLH